MFYHLVYGWNIARTTDTQWRHKSKISEKLGRCGRQNILRPYLKIWDWEWIFGRAEKAISSPGVRSPWYIAFFREYLDTISKVLLLWRCLFESNDYGRAKVYWLEYLVSITLPLLWPPKSRFSRDRLGISPSRRWPHSGSIWS